MRKVIDWKMYDTETATLLGEYAYGYGGDFDRIEEGLYRTKSGRYFIAGNGGPRTKYAVAISQNCWSGGSDIFSLTKEEALVWAEVHLDADEIEKAFGAEIEDA